MPDFFCTAIDFIVPFTGKDQSDGSSVTSLGLGFKVYILDRKTSRKTSRSRARAVNGLLGLQSRQ